MIYSASTLEFQISYLLIIIWFLIKKERKFNHHLKKLQHIITIKIRNRFSYDKLNYLLLLQNI